MPNRSSSPARGIPLRIIHVLMYDNDMLSLHYSDSPDPEAPDIVLVPGPNSSFGILHNGVEVWRIETSPDTLNLLGKLRRAWSILTWKSK